MHQADVHGNEGHHGDAPDAQLGSHLSDYSKVDMMDSPYKFVNSGDKNGTHQGDVHEHKVGYDHEAPDTQPKTS